MRELYITFTATKRFEETSYLLKKTVRDAVKATLDYEQFPYDTEVSVTFCDNEYIRGLNNEFRGIDRHTDVLSFPMYESGEFDEAECSMGAAPYTRSNHVNCKDLTLASQRVIPKGLV